MDKAVDILVVGGGLTGATLLLALANKGLKVSLVEANPFSEKIHKDFDARSLALSPASVRILEKLSIWELLKNEATPIESIHISEQFRFGKAKLVSQEKEPLGYVIEMQYINKALYELLGKEVLAPAKLCNLENNLATIQYQNKLEKIQAQLIVAADGSLSTVRSLTNLSVKTKDYSQHALVTNIGLARSHENAAFERFTASGPLAMLPLSDQRASLVWSLEPTMAAELAHMEERKFLAHLQKVFGYKMGRFTKAGKRIVYPLQSLIMPKHCAWPLVFVGNAAHTLHPVAGQGFNLGLRDVATLAQCIMQEGLTPSMLNKYSSMRLYDHRSIAALTHGLVNVFTTNIPGMQLARQVGLLTFDNMNFLKNIVSRHAKGFAGILPDLVCGREL